VSPKDLHGRRLFIDVERTDGTVLIALAGELDIGSAGELDDVLLEAERSGARTIRLDLRKLEFLDSTGLRAILSAELRTSVDGSKLLLIPGPERVQRLFALTGTAEFLHFADGDMPPDNVSDLRGDDIA
jgi:anti-anti-sigma factor